MTTEETGNGTEARASVVVCTYTSARLAHLRRAVASVRAQRGVAVELVVVVDHDDDLLDLLRAELGGGDTVVVPNSGKRGLSAARNSGVEAASRELVAFLDDDAEAEPTWLAEMATVLEERGAALVGGTVLPRLEGERPAWWPRELDWVVGCSYPGQVPHEGFPDDLSRVPPAVRVRNAIGASMLSRRSALLAAGGFATALGRVGNVPVGGEETELCIRLAGAHGKDAVWLATRSVVHHAVPGSRLTARYLLSRCYAEGVSKAVLGRLVRGPAALSSELRYLLTTLPWAALRHVGAVLRGDLAGPARAGALAVGALATAFGWLRGRLAPPRSLAGGEGA